jgi:hypothetical protein
VRSTAAPYTESRLTHLVRNKCVGFPVVEHIYISHYKTATLSYKYVQYNNVRINENKIDIE